MVSDVFLFLILVAIFFLKKNSICIDWHFLPYFILILIQLIFLCSGELDFKKIGSTIRYLFYIGTICFCLHENFNIEFAKKVYQKVCIISTTYLIIQTVLYKFLHLYLPGYFQNSIFPVVSDQVSVLENSVGQTWFLILRPSSFFAEPAHYAEYVLGYLTIELFFEKEKVNFFVPAFLLLGILLAMSSTGILGAVVILSLYFVKRLLNKKTITFLIAFLLIIPCFLYAVLNSSFFEHFSERMTEGSSTAGRMNGYSDMFNNVFENPFFLIFGEGMGSSLDHYLAGFARLINYFGLVGLLCFVFVVGLILFDKKISLYQKILLFVFLILNVGTELLFQPFVFVFLPFILCIPSEKRSVNVSLCDFKL